MKGWVLALLLAGPPAFAAESPPPDFAGHWVGDARLFDKALRAQATPLEADIRISRDLSLRGRIGSAAIPTSRPVTVSEGRVEWRIVLEGRVKALKALDKSHLVILATPRGSGVLDAEFHLKSRFGFDPTMRVGHLDVRRLE